MASCLAFRYYPIVIILTTIVTSQSTEKRYCSQQPNCRCPQSRRIVCANSTLTRIPAVTKPRLVHAIRLINTRLDLLRVKQNLRNLRQIAIFNSNLTAFSVAEITAAGRSLTTVVIVGAQIRHVDTRKGKRMTALRHLSLRHNRIESTARFDRFPALTTLMLGGNRIRRIRPIDFPASIVNLCLADNRIRINRNRSDFRRFANLRRLSLRGNRLHRFSLADLPPGVEGVDLSRSRLKFVDLSGAGKFTARLALDLRHNPIRCTCHFLRHYHDVIATPRNVTFRCDVTNSTCVRCAGSGWRLDARNTTRVEALMRAACGRHDNGGDSDVTTVVPTEAGLPLTTLLPLLGAAVAIAVLAVAWCKYRNR